MPSDLLTQTAIAGAAGALTIRLLPDITQGQIEPMTKLVLGAIGLWVLPGLGNQMATAAAKGALAGVAVDGALDLAGV